MVSHECALPFAFCIEKVLQFLYCLETDAIISFCSITSLLVQLWGFSASANNDIIHDILQKVAAIPCGLSSPSRRIRTRQPRGLARSCENRPNLAERTCPAGGCAWHTSCAGRVFLHSCFQQRSWSASQESTGEGGTPALLLSPFGEQNEQRLR